MATGILSITIHSNKDRLFENEDDADVDGILLALAAQICASTFLSIEGAFTECKHASEVAKEYELLNTPIPFKMFQRMMVARTLCFRHPMFEIINETNVKPAPKSQLAPAPKARPATNSV